MLSQSHIMRTIQFGDIEMLKNQIECSSSNLINHVNNKGDTVLHGAVLSKKYIQIY